VRLASVVEHALGSRDFSRIDVRDDANVPHFLNGH
jgi:hypothetical protein